MGRNVIFALVLFSLIITMQSCKKSPHTLATVGNEEISISEFKELLEVKRPGRQLSRIPFTERKKILMNHLEGRAKAMKARELKLDEGAQLQAQLRRREERLLASKYPEILVVEKFVTAEMITAFSDIQTSKPRIITVALGFEGSKLIKASRSKDEAISLANQIYEQIKAGKDIAELSTQYTDNEALKKKKGLYDPYTAGALHPIVDVRVNQAKIAEIIEPIYTDHGIFIIEILTKNDSAKVTLGEKHKNKIRVNMYNKFFRSAGDSVYQNLSKKFSSELGGEIYDDGIDKFIMAVEAWENTPNPTDLTFTEEQRSILLGKIGDITITSGYFIDEFQGTFKSNYRRYRTREDWKKMLNDYVQRYLAWIIKAREAGIDKRPDVQELLKKFLDSKLVAIFDQKEIKEKADPSEDQMLEYYQKNKTKYIEHRRIRIWEIALKDEKTAQIVLNKAKKTGADFSALAEEYTDKINLRGRGGDLGYQSVKSTRDIVKSAFEAGENQIIGPIKERNLYYVIKTGDIQPERQKEYEEVQIPVKSSTRHENEIKLREEWRKKFEREYDIWIDETKLKELS
jgi:hypothetical protein